MTGAAGSSTGGCIFCAAAADSGQDESLLVLARRAQTYVILNRYPYNNGHLMVVTNRHVATLHASMPDELSELMQLVRHAEIALTEAYAPQGINVGINIGRPAGAGSSIICTSISSRDGREIPASSRWSARSVCCPRSWGRRRPGCARSSNGSAPTTSEPRGHRGDEDAEE